MDKWVDDEHIHGYGFWQLCAYRSSKGLHMPGSSGFGMVNPMSPSSLSTCKASHVESMSVSRAGCSPCPQFHTKLSSVLTRSWTTHTVILFLLIKKRECVHCHDVTVFMTFEGSGSEELCNENTMHLSAPSSGGV